MRRDHQAAPEPDVITAAADIIRASDREHPADAVLRQELRHRRSAEDRPAIAEAVFAYYRWLGWLNPREDLRKRVNQALKLAVDFAAQPRAFSSDDLISKAVPKWIHGEMTANADYARALQTPPKLWIRARPGTGTSLAKRLVSAQPFGTGQLGDALTYSGSEDLFLTEDFQNGRLEVQDITSQAVGLICLPHPGETWWDACAGEGGKTMLLSDLMENKGLVWASDRAEWRLKKLRTRAARAGVFNYRAVLWNGTKKLPTRTRFDGVLVDAPCSGIGTWARNPHARWTTSLTDVLELADRQLELLVNASAAVKPGGRLIYSVCTLARSETTGVVERFEAQAPAFKPEAIENPLKPGSSATPLVWLWPQRFGGNGMFVASWKRVSA